MQSSSKSSVSNPSLVIYSSSNGSDAALKEAIGSNFYGFLFLSLVSAALAGP
jgi:hypothetical protein